jgi:outer membrane protein assembly factor BamB
MQSSKTVIALLTILTLTLTANATAAEDWLQFKYDSRHSGNAPDRNVTTPLSLLGAVPLTDAVFTAPVVSEERVYIIDGSGVVFCIATSTFDVLWKFDTGVDKTNCNNVSSPAIAGRYLHL